MNSYWECGKFSKLKGEVGMAGKKRTCMHTMVVRIVRYTVHPYSFSSNGISVKSCRDVLCTLISLYAYFFTCHPYFTFQLFFFILVTALVLLLLGD